MALTRDFRETVQARARRDPAFRRALLREAIGSMLAGDLKTGKLVLRNYINATTGFARLGRAIQKSPKSLMRMFGEGGNPWAKNMFSTLGHLQKVEGVCFMLRDVAKARKKEPKKRSRASRSLSIKD